MFLCVYTSIIAWVFANGLGDGGSVPGQVIPDQVLPKTQKLVLDDSLLNNQHYTVWIKGKWSNLGKVVAPPLHLSVVANEKGAFKSSLIMVSQLICVNEIIWSFLPFIPC